VGTRWEWVAKGVRVRLCSNKERKRDSE